MWTNRLDQNLNRLGPRVGAYLFALAFAIHLCYLCQYARTPFFWVPELDSLYDDLAARSIAAGHVDHAAFFRAPLYLYFLAGIYKVFGHSYWAARLVQAGIGSGSVVLLYQLGTRTMQPSIGLIAAVSMALYGPLVYNDGELHTPVLEVFLDLAMLNLCLVDATGRCERLTAVDAPRQPKLYALAGLILGLSAITRPTVLITLPVLLWWIINDNRVGPRSESPTVGKAGVAQRGGEKDSPSPRHAPHPGGRPAPGWSLPSIGLAVAIFLLTAAVFPTLVTIRNWRASGDPVFIASQGGINLFLGNRPQADGFTPSTPARYRFDDEYEDSVALYGQRAAEDAAGHRLTASQAQRYWIVKSILWWKSDPMAAIRLTGKKIVLAWTHREIRNNTAYDFVREKLAPFLWVCGIGFWIAGPLSIAGITLGVREPAVRRLTAFALVYMAGIVPFFMADRYRLPVIPILLLLSAYAVVRLCELAPEFKSGRKTALALAIAALIFGVALVDIDWVRTETPKTWALDYWSMGNRYVRLGRFDKAEATFRKATRLDPDNGDIWNGLGESLYDQGRIADAALSFRHALLTGPDRGRAAYNEALCHEQGGDSVSAKQLLRFALNVDPGYDRARRELDRLARAR